MDSFFEINFVISFTVQVIVIKVDAFAMISISFELPFIIISFVQLLNSFKF